MRQLISQLISELLWQSNAFQVSLNNPFKLVSGNFSPIYINCRALISNAAAMDLVAASMHFVCQVEGISIDVVAGGETAGIPFASFIANRISKPMVYVRKQVKEHGLNSLVEGTVKQGANVLLVEDLITDGKSKMAFITPLRELGCLVENCLVVFDRQQGGQTYLSAHGVRLHTLTDLATTLAVGRSSGRLSENQLKEIERYLTSPDLWHSERELQFRP